MGISDSRIRSNGLSRILKHLLSSPSKSWSLLSIPLRISIQSTVQTVSVDRSSAKGGSFPHFPSRLSICNARTVGEVQADLSARTEPVSHLMKMKRGATEREIPLTAISREILAYG